jgi:hypothetical protein
VIRGYRAMVDPAAVGRSLRVFAGAIGEFVTTAAVDNWPSYATGQIRHLA